MHKSIETGFQRGNGQDSDCATAIEIVAENTVLVPEGPYLVRFTHFRIDTSWATPKLMLHFSIVEGGYSGLLLVRFYNVTVLDTPSSATVRFQAPSRGHFLREFRSCFPDEQEYPDLDPNVFKNKTVRATVETVRRDGRKRELPPNNHYSVIRELLGIVPENYANGF